MQIPIDNAATIGRVVRASRKAQKIRQDDAAGASGVSENFLGKIERGSGSVQWGKLFQVLEGLGIWISVDVPDSVAAYLNTPSNDGEEARTAGRCARPSIRPLLAHAPSSKK